VLSTVAVGGEVVEQGVVGPLDEALVEVDVGPDVGVVAEAAVIGRHFGLGVGGDDQGDVLGGGVAAEAFAALGEVVDEELAGDGGVGLVGGADGDQGGLVGVSLGEGLDEVDRALLAVGLEVPAEVAAAAAVVLGALEARQAVQVE